MVTSFFAVMDTTGETKAIHKRIDHADGTKSVSWFRPDGAVGLGGVPVSALPLYGAERLPTLPPSSTIVVVEGEKVAQALVDDGIPAVGTVTGAASTPGPEALAALEGRVVVLAPDNDDAGRQHMLRVAEALDDIAAVGWLEPPSGTAKGWDLADAIVEGIDVVALLKGATAVPITAAEAWPEPKPLARRSRPMAFPVEALPEWLRTFVIAEAEATQTPVDMAAMFALAAVATVTAGCIRIEPVAGWVEGLNIFVVVAMEPGSRKSAVHRDINAPVVAYEKLLLEQARPDLAEQETIRRIAQAALAKTEKAAAGAKDDLERGALEEEARMASAALERLEEPTPPRLFTADVTPEKLASLLYENDGRMAVLSAEGGIFEIMAGRYSSGVPNLDVYLAGHAGDPIRVDRRGRATEWIDQPALTMGLAVQPFVLGRAARVAEFGGRGLLDRFLYALPTGMVGYRRTDARPVPAHVRERYDSTLRALAAAADNIGDTTVVLTLSSGAETAFQRWRDAVEPRRRPDADLGHVQGWASKLDGTVARIAGLIHVAETFTNGWGEPVGSTTMEAAIDIGRYLIEHALAAYDEMGADPALDGARRVLTWIRREGRTSFTKRECHIAHRALFRRASDIDPTLAILEDHGYIRETTRERRVGRPSQRFEVNPRMWSQKPQNSQNPDT